MAKKLNGLGKGLDALFIESGMEENRNTAEGAVVTSVRIADVEPDKNQPRKNFDDEAIKTLAESIALHGVLQPIVVRSAAGNDADENTKKMLEGKYRIISGERRWRLTRLVLTRTVSVNASFGPLTVFSTSGGDGLRLSPVLVSKATA